MYLILLLLLFILRNRSLSPETTHPLGYNIMYNILLNSVAPAVTHLEFNNLGHG